MHFLVLSSQLRDLDKEEYELVLQLRISNSNFEFIDNCHLDPSQQEVKAARSQAAASFTTSLIVLQLRISNSNFEFNDNCHLDPKQVKASSTRLCPTLD
jgi:hypothetical protein